MAQLAALEDELQLPRLGSIQALHDYLGAVRLLRRYADWIMGLGVLGLVVTLITPGPNNTMLMASGLSPELTQAAYRVGDSCTNVVTPMNPYFPLVVVFCQRYVKGAGVGTLTAMMLPYCAVFLVLWTAYLLAWWGLGLPLGFEAPYVWP